MIGDSYLRTICPVFIQIYVLESLYLLQIPLWIPEYMGPDSYIFGIPRRLQFAEARSRAIDRCRSRHRLHPGGLHEGWAPVRRNSRQRGQLPAFGLPARAHTERAPHSQQRTQWDAVHPQGARRIDVRSKAGQDLLRRAETGGPHGTQDTR